jgi:hypothetical protein
MAIYRLYISNCKAVFIFMLVFFVSVLSAGAQTKQELNPLAKKHLNTEQIESLTSADINTINFYFTSSYILDKTNPYYIKWLDEHGGVFDVYELYKFRKQSQRAFFKAERYPGFVIELLSWDEIEQVHKKFINLPENQNK